MGRYSNRRPDLHVFDVLASAVTDPDVRRLDDRLRELLAAGSQDPSRPVERVGFSTYDYSTGTVVELPGLGLELVSMDAPVEVPPPLAPVLRRLLRNPTGDERTYIWRESVEVRERAIWSIDPPVPGAGPLRIRQGFPWFDDGQEHLLMVDAGGGEPAVVEAASEVSVDQELRLPPFSDILVELAGPRYATPLAVDLVVRIASSYPRISVASISYGGEAPETVRQPIARWLDEEERTLRLSGRVERDTLGPLVFRTRRRAVPVGDRRKEGDVEELRMEDAGCRRHGDEGWGMWDEHAG